MPDVHAPSFSIQAVISILFATCATALLVVLLGFAAMRQVDADSAAREHQSADVEIQEECARLSQEQRGSTIWGQTVLQVRAGNIGWMDRNIGFWLQTQYGHDAVHIVRPDGTLQYSASAQALTLKPGQRLPVELEGPVGRLRHQMHEMSAGLENSSVAISGLGLTDVLRLGGRPALVAVAPIVAWVESVPQRPGSEFIHVSVQYLDSTLAERISRAGNLRGAFFTDRPPSRWSESGYPLRNAEGAVVTWFVWQAERPGLRMVQAMGPALALAGLLGAALLAWLLRRTWRDTEQLHRRETEARYLASNDLLAGLPNRMHFEQVLARALDEEGRGGPPVTLLLIDLDRFKEVNDTLGHAAGDELLRQVAARLRAQARASDMAARLGGDEFGLILLGLQDEDRLSALCSGLVQVLSQPYRLEAGEVHVGASIGGAIAGEVGSSMETVLHCADVALYRAKKEGRARFRLFTPEMDETRRRRRRIEQALWQALDQKDGLDVAFQPICSPEGRIVAVEALARWPSAPEGMVPPDLFIDIAEECGLIHSLGAWILERACRVIADTGLARVAVNVSPLQVRLGDFADEVLGILKTTELPPSRLELELTEHFHLDPGATTRANLQTLRAAGVTITLDDFATGQSLLQDVRDYEVDAIKIDRTFVRRLGEGDGTDDVVRAVLALGHARGLKVTAEGVETVRQREILFEMGCRLFQGYLFGMPVESDRLPELMRRAEERAEDAG